MVTKWSNWTGIGFVVTIGVLIAIALSGPARLGQAISPPPTPELAETLVPCAGPNGPANAPCRWTPTDNSLIVRIEGNLQGKAGDANEVVALYWNDEEGPFRTAPAPVNRDRYVLHVGRLRAETAYEFQLFLKGSDVVPFATGYFTTEPLPEGLQKAEIEVRTGVPTSTLTFMDLNVHTVDEDPGFYGLVAINGDGEIVWYAETGGATGAMTQKRDGNIVFIEEGFGLREITPTGQEVRAIQSPCRPDILYHHEIELMLDGSAMTLGYDIRDPFDDPDRLQVGDTIWLWNPVEGSLREAWNAFDFLDPAVDRTERSSVREEDTWRGCEVALPTEDWTHASSAKLAPTGDIILSLRHLNQVLSISPDFQSVNWRLGGPGSDFAFPDPADHFHHQHTARQLFSGNILLFDNGNTRPDDDGGEYSRALELELDFQTMTAHKVWEFAPSQTFSPCCSSVERLPNGNTLVLFSPDPEDPDSHATLIEVDAEENVVWEVRIWAPGQRVIYRAYPGESALGEVPAE